MNEVTMDFNVEKNISFNFSVSDINDGKKEDHYFGKMKEFYNGFYGFLATLEEE